MKTKAWTRLEIKRVCRHRDSGKSIAFIAGRLGRSLGSVRYMVSKIDAFSWKVIDGIPDAERHDIRVIDLL